MTFEIHKTASKTAILAVAQRLTTEPKKKKCIYSLLHLLVLVWQSQVLFLMTSYPYILLYAQFKNEKKNIDDLK